MSIITGDGGRLGGGRGDEVIQNQYTLNSIANSSCTTTSHSNGSTSTQQVLQPPPPVKKKRNLPGNPDPNAEVIALSPKTLLATNRFVCEICNKGFQRDQNLQLHRRGHNLPWKLRQRTSNEVIRRRVYVCPETSCVHHNPARALGDLTGIKKHFCRKHIGEKKWKCEKCSKKYAVQSDWRAHTKTCGTKEYKCDCGTIFSRRDSFITHRAFCDALIQEENGKAFIHNIESNLQAAQLHVSPNNIISSIPINNNNNNNPNHSSLLPDHFNHLDTKIPLSLPHELVPIMPSKPSGGSIFASSTNTPSLFGSSRSMSSSSSSLHFNANNSSSMFEANGHHFASMSATALLQKAAQMGAATATTTTSSNNNNFVITSMASSTIGANQTQNGQPQVRGADGAAYIDQYFNAKNDVGIFTSSNINKGVFYGATPRSSHGFGGDPTNGIINSSSCLSSGFNGDDVMTVDFLGIGRSRPRYLHELQVVQEREFRGVLDNDDDHPRMQVLNHHHHQFEQQAAAAEEKSIWDA